MRTVYTRAPHALYRNAGRDVVAMLPGVEEVHVLSGPAAVIWDLVAEEVTRDDLIPEIADLYARTMDDVAPSIDACIRDLANRGLVKERRA